MNLPTIKGLIDRRILINYLIDAEVLSSYLPSPFRPQLIKGKGVAGICLIRLKNIRPKGFPAFVGIGSENAAHRFAVEWEQDGKTQQGVYIPRRDTSSRINAWAGGNIFPGVHYLAKFDVEEKNDAYKVSFNSAKNTFLSISAEKTTLWNEGSVFKNVEEASAFFEKGCLGYCPDGDGFDGVELRIDKWNVSPLKVNEVRSSFFEDKNLFPSGSIQFDNALLMLSLDHEWHTRTSLRVNRNAVSTA